ncbi:MAG: YgiT-type zinc finger protein [Chloroflexi bacterium]|nr:YgiT-type zinc finger protein [Chloroflexota bacterium]
MSQRMSYTCPRCQIGQCRPVTLTYTRLYQGTLLSVPDMPAWTCDICGLQEYDQQMLGQLERLIGQGSLPPRPALGDKPPKSGKAPRLKS